MDIASIGGAGALQPPDPAEMRKHMQQVMAPVADLLGLSGDQLQLELQGGAKLSDLADAKGISHDELVAAVQKGLDANPPPSGTKAPADLAERIADGKVGSHHHHRHPHAPPAAPSSSTQTAAATGLSSLSGLLGVDKDQLSAAGGEDLFSLAAAKGLSKDDVLQVLSEGVQINKYA